MTRKIYMTEQEIEEFTTSVHTRLIKESSTLKNKRFLNGDEEIEFTFKINAPKKEKNAQLFFTPKALIKMHALVRSFSCEVEWHGTVKRVDETTFLVEDFLVFPHEATGTSVISNQTEYEKWLDSLDEETFNALRFHGHSHVNMAVSPSCVDTSYRANIINNFGTPSKDDDYFYIFLITNKRQEINVEIYDLQNNVSYGTSDVSIDVMFDGEGILEDFIKNSKGIVTEKDKLEEYNPSSCETSQQCDPNKTNQSKLKKSAKSAVLRRDCVNDDVIQHWYEEYYGGE